MENSGTGKNRRKTFAAREDLIEEMSKSAGDKGISLYSFINDAFEATLKAEKKGMTLQKLIEGLESLKASRETGFILGLESLWYEMTELAYEKARDEALKCWSDAGVWLAKSYLSKGDCDPFLAFKKQLETFTWNTSELDMKEIDDRVIIRVISPRFTESYTSVLASFLEGAIGALGYKNISRDVSRGTIRLTARREGNELGEATR
jgi:hypothetical protein